MTEKEVHATPVGEWVLRKHNTSFEVGFMPAGDVCSWLIIAAKQWSKARKEAPAAAAKLIRAYAEKQHQRAQVLEKNAVDLLAIAKALES